MLPSIEGQFDEINIVLNNFKSRPKELKGMRCIIPGEDLTDNGKFYTLEYLTEDCYYFTLDDDIIYPKDYVEKTVQAIEDYKSIISWHGRIITDPNQTYYSIDGIRYYQLTNQPYFLDVLGTGVTAFDTRYFKPKGLVFNENKRMSDLIFSLEASKEGKSIVSPPKKFQWIKGIETDTSIYLESKRADQTKHNEIVKQIGTRRSI